LIIKTNKPYKKEDNSINKKKITSLKIYVYLKNEDQHQKLTLQNMNAKITCLGETVVCKS